ncbi:MAG: potassium-transporting ATPase subunit KdpC [Bacteroidetes bacterium]|nr:potassium-transporting ATPase subunit KdpC [Bacteroidota bacterium]
MKQHLLPALKLTLFCLLLCSGLYTLLLLGIAKLTPNGGNAATVELGGRTQYTNIAQAFTQNKYFQPRPSAVEYNAAGSGGSNKGPGNPEFITTVKARIDTFMAHNPGVAKAGIPSELVTASASGLDPHLTPKAAMAQAQRVAAARGIPTARVEQLITLHTQGPLLGLFGPATVNVLQLNLALDAATK